MSPVIDSFDAFSKQPCPGGFCQPRHVCPQGGPGQSVDPQDAGLITLRLLEDEDEDICLDLMMTCCLTPNVTTNPSSYGTIKVDNNDIFPNDTCGESNPGGLKYKLESDGAGKAYAQYGEFPWMVVLIEETYQSSGQSRYEPIGGASLIHPRFVVTVAHILENPLPNRVFARFGEWDFASQAEYWPVEDIDLNKNVFIHPNYIARGFKNDIALAKLEQPLVYKTHIRPICLPTSAAKDQFEGQRCTSNGWGVEMKTRTYASVMKRVDLPILPREKCETMLRASRLGPFFKLHSSVICAGGERDLDMCTGDGGSPLACRTSAGKYELAGIVSWGLSCGDQNTPAGYVDVAQFVGWIHEKIAENDVA
ncbi:inactive CLIP domain-containing serine protease A8-like [Anopheles bellator]|uniref:inactive CLIP domain-containing serine protease A8-like n=1 Tax=Anopheles bellator TaxID=139047 RepID=UPI002647FC77|nr:inactive CLIP domain-containing serine protease A8-like [Anopheles bellator]